jgi:signal transduction histidine kinase
VRAVTTLSRHQPPHAGHGVPHERVADRHASAPHKVAPLRLPGAPGRAAGGAGSGRRALSGLPVLSSLLGVVAEPRLRARTLATLAANLARAIDVPVLTIRLLDPSGRWLDLKASIGLPRSLQAQLRRISVDSMAGQAIAGRSRRVAVASRRHPSVLPPWPRKLAQRFRAGAFVPIRAGGTMLGVLGVAYREPARPPLAQMRFLEALGRELGAALQVVRAREARGKAHAEALTLRKITAALSSNLEPRTVLDMVTAAAAQLTRASGAIVLLQSSDRTEVEIASQSDGLDGTSLIGMRFASAGSLAARVIRSGRSFRCRDVSRDRRPMIRRLVALGNVRGLLIAPLRTADGVFGTLNVSSARPRLFSDRDRRILAQLGQHASIAIQNARLFDAARRHRLLLRKLYSRQFTTLEGERKRIAHELHDEMGPTLSATLINLQLVQSLGAADATLSAKVGETVGLLRGLVEKVRELSYGLRPPMLEHLGLAESVKWMIDTYFSRGKLAVSYRSSGVDTRLDPDLALAVYRIAQEGLTNVVRHADATRARVRLRIGPSLVTLCIEDDGRGFEVHPDVPERRSGLGLAGMRERMEQLRGRLAIRSAPGRGCRLTVSCPIEGSRARIAG